MVCQKHLGYSTTCQAVPETDCIIMRICPCFLQSGLPITQPLCSCFLSVDMLKHNISAVKILLLPPPANPHLEMPP